MPETTQPWYQTSQEVKPRKKKAYVGHRIRQEIKVSGRVQRDQSDCISCRNSGLGFFLFETLYCSPTVLWPWADLPSKGQPTGPGDDLLVNSILPPSFFILALSAPYFGNATAKHWEEVCMWTQKQDMLPSSHLPEDMFHLGVKRWDSRLRTWWWSQWWQLVYTKAQELLRAVNASARSLQVYVSLRWAKEGLGKQVQARTNERQDKILKKIRNLMIVVLSPSDSGAGITSKLQSYLQGWIFEFLLKLFFSLLAHAIRFPFPHTGYFLTDLLTVCFLRAKAVSFVTQPCSVTWALIHNWSF